MAPDTLPAWLTEEDVDYFAAEYGRDGFSGGLNWYRNIDFNWKMTPFLEGAKLLQPTIHLLTPPTVYFILTLVYVFSILCHSLRGMI